MFKKLLIAMAAPLLLSAATVNAENHLMIYTGGKYMDEFMTASDITAWLELTYPSDTFTDHIITSSSSELIEVYSDDYCTIDTGCTETTPQKHTDITDYPTGTFDDVTVVLWEGESDASGSTANPYYEAAVQDLLQDIRDDFPGKDVYTVVMESSQPIGTVSLKGIRAQQSSLGKSADLNGAIRTSGYWSGNPLEITDFWYDVLALDVAQQVDRMWTVPTAKERAIILAGGQYIKDLSWQNIRDDLELLYPDDNITMLRTTYAHNEMSFWSPLWCVINTCTANTLYYDNLMNAVDVNYFDTATLVFWHGQGEVTSTLTEVENAYGVGLFGLVEDVRELIVFETSEEMGVIVVESNDSIDSDKVDEMKLSQGLLADDEYTNVLMESADLFVGTATTMTAANKTVAADRIVDMVDELLTPSEQSLKVDISGLVNNIKVTIQDGFTEVLTNQDNQMGVVIYSSMDIGTAYTIIALDPVDHTCVVSNGSGNMDADGHTVGVVCAPI